MNTSALKFATSVASQRILFSFCVSLIGNVSSALMPFSNVFAQGFPTDRTSPAERPASGERARTPDRLMPVDRSKEVANYVKDETIKDESRPSGTGFSIYAGLDLGFAQVLAKETEFESNKAGYHLGVKGIASVFTEDVTLDFGAGYLYNQVSGDRDVEVKPDGTTYEVLDPQVKTQSVFLEFSPRLRVGESFEFGPSGLAFLGNESSFSNDTSKSKNAIFAGLTAYWKGGKDLLWRTGPQVHFDVNLFERNVILAAWSFQIGLPIVKQKTIVRDRRTLSVKENVRLKPVEKQVEKIVVKEQVRFLFEEQIINFEFDKSVLSRRSDYLVANPDSFDSILIEGHTDDRGSAEYNNKLSLDRATSVKLALQKYGVPASRIRAFGYGFARPLDPARTEIAWARNRRVEMTFNGVKDPNRLREYIDRIKDQFQHFKGNY
jgi:peptidoglycan-associated lipoprotein